MTTTTPPAAPTRPRLVHPAQPGWEPDVLSEGRGLVFGLLLGLVLCGAGFGIALGVTRAVTR